MITPLVKLTFFFALLFVCVGCEQSTTQDIAGVVKTSMQQKFSSDPEFMKWHLTVHSVDVVHQSGNSYRGIAHVSYKGITRDIPIEITADATNTLWQAPPGSFMFVAQDELKDLQDELR